MNDKNDKNDNVNDKNDINDNVNDKSDTNDKSNHDDDGNALKLDNNEAIYTYSVNPCYILTKNVE